MTNLVILLGRVGKDPVVNVTKTGKKIVSFYLATSEGTTTNEKGEKVPLTEWHNITCFEKTADVVEKFVSKGDELYVEGRIKTEKYKDKEGVEKYATKILVNRVQLVGGKKKETAEQAEDSDPLNVK